MNKSAWKIFSTIVISLVLLVSCEISRELVSSITLNYSSASVELENTLQLSATLTPATAKIKDVEWTSRNPAVATVDAYGKVTAVAPGTTIVTVTTKDGSNISATCNIKVMKPGVKATFDSNGGSSIESQTVLPGSKLTAPTVPSKEHYAFEGWYTDTSYTNKWDFAKSTITKDITLYARWINTLHLEPKYVDDKDVTQGLDKMEEKYLEAGSTIKLLSSSSSVLSAGWYVVEGTVDFSSNLLCISEVHLILANGCELKCKGIEGLFANSLTIYSQTTDTNNMGKLKTEGTDGYPGILCNDELGQLTINGGAITAIGKNNAAGIGGMAGEDGSNIIINGGSVTATGGKYGAGIGGGRNSNGTNITINGGSVTATGGEYGAGIGGGGDGGPRNGKGTHITIKGGSVTATGGGYGAENIGNGGND